MTRRSTRLMRLENSLYNYNHTKESWDVKEITQTNNTSSTDLFELGSYFTCKHMSQKVNPISFRISNNKTWNSAWYSNYKSINLDSGKLQIDLSIRKYIESVLKQLKILVDKIQIKEINNTYIVKIHLYEEGVFNKKDITMNSKRIARFKPYLIADKKEFINPFYKEKSKEAKNWFINPKKVLNLLESQLKKQLNKEIYISLVYKKDLGDSASLLGNYLCKELEKPNMNFKRVLRDSLQKIKDKSKIRGLRVNCSGRLGRAPMAKMEWFKYGSIPLTKLSAEIDYTQLAGKTRYGSFGIKVWLYKH